MQNGTTDYQQQFDPARMTVGGAAGVLTVDASPGRAMRSGRRTTSSTRSSTACASPTSAFTVHTQMLGPFAGTTPEGSESMGLFVGPGDQDNFVRLALAANGGTPQLELSSEVDGVATTASAPVSLADISTIDLYLTVDPSLDTITARFRVTTDDRHGAAHRRG